MKTFKLKGLAVVDNEKESEKMRKAKFELIDGLVINREDEAGWIVEAFLSKEYYAYFADLQDESDIMIQVKITREDNDPAFFITKIIDITDIGDKMNVIFQGNIVDHSKSRIEELLQQIIEEGYQGESLLKKFKESI